MKIITFKDIFHVLVKNKKLFVITFLIIFIAGLIFFFVRVPVYSIEMPVKLSDNYGLYDNFLLNNFPSKSKALWLFKDSKIISEENRILHLIGSEIASDQFLYKLVGLLNFSVDFNELKESIYPYQQQSRFLTILVVSDSGEKAYEILEKLIGLLKNEKKEQLEIAHGELIDRIDKKIENIIKKHGKQAIIEEGADDAGTLTDKKLYNNLVLARQNLLDNKSNFINRIELVEELNIINIHNYTNRARGITISFFLGIFASLIASFLKFYIIILKSNKKPGR